MMRQQQQQQQYLATLIAFALLLFSSFTSAFFGFGGLARRKRIVAPKPAKTNVTTVQQLDQYFDHVNTKNADTLLRQLNVVGDTQFVDATHPVGQILHNRRRRQNNADQAKVALAIEGGGMRGCISAGMICALHHLNLTDCFDEIYGSSAGGIVGAYFNTGQLPWFGPEVYYDQLPKAGKQFIDTKRLLRSLGLGLLDPRLLKDVIVRRKNGKPVLNLSYLLKRTVQETKPLNWNKFVERQKVQPLHIVASGLKSEEAVVLNLENGGFSSLETLTDAMHASCLLPGIAGPLMNMNLETKELVLGNQMDIERYEPLADALVYEPLPYRSAIKNGATHVVVCRSRPDGIDVTGKGGTVERMIFRRFFMRKNYLPRIFDYFAKHLHKKLYAEDVLRLNEEAKSSRDPDYRSKPHLFPIAVPSNVPEISRLEKNRQTIFDGFRNGFARAYDALVEDPKEKGRGMIVAMEYFPDEIMDYDPLTIESKDESAFDVYMRESGISPKSWEESVADTVEIL